jgi:hypothetical protein
MLYPGWDMLAGMLGGSSTEAGASHIREAVGPRLIWILRLSVGL